MWTNLIDLLIIFLIFIYSNVIGVAGGKGVETSRNVSMNISKHATAVNTMAPTAIGQKSYFK